MVERLHLEAAKRLLEVVDNLEKNGPESSLRGKKSQVSSSAESTKNKTTKEKPSVQSVTTLYRVLTGFDDTAFCHKISQALADGWTLHGPTQYVANPTTGKMHCGQAVIKKTRESYDPERTLSEYQTYR